MSRSLILGLLATTVLLGLAWYFLRSTGMEASGVRPVTREASESATAPPSTSVVDAPLEVDLAPAPTDSAPRSIAPTASRGRSIEGRVLDTLGEPLHGVGVHPLWGRNELVLAETDEDGSFRFDTTLRDLWLTASRPGFTTVRTWEVADEVAEPRALIVMARAIDIAGHVVDEGGNAVAGAHLSVGSDWRGVIGFPLPLDGTSLAESAATVSAEDGTFELESAPLIPGRALSVRASGFRTAQLELPEESTTSFLVRLQARPEQASGTPKVEGWVLFPDGAPAEGARVAIAGGQTSTDVEGRFTSTNSPDSIPDLPIVAMLEGWQPAVLRQEEFSAVAMDALVLTLPGRALSIAGRLQHVDGSPATEWRVRLNDPTLLSAWGLPPPTAEQLGEPDTPVITDDDGRFELGGLADREYTLFLWHWKTFACFEFGPLPAGGGERLPTVPADVLLERLEGRVVTADGVPVAGASLGATFVTQRNAFGHEGRGVARTTTAANGSFELHDLPRSRMLLDVRGHLIAPQTIELDTSGRDPNSTEVVVERLVAFRIDYSSATPPPGALRVRDARGIDLMIYQAADGGSSSTSRMTLEQGRSAVLYTHASAVTLRLEDGEPRPEVVSDRPLHWSGGEVHLLTP